MTVSEKRWLDAICGLGCIVCYLLGFPRTPAVPHHMLRGGRRMGHLFTIPLCDPGHHQYPPAGSEKISRHTPHGKTRFEAEYGTEAELLSRTRRLVAKAQRVAA